MDDGHKISNTVINVIHQQNHLQTQIPVGKANNFVYFAEVDDEALRGLNITSLLCSVWILGAFAKLRKAIISFVMSVCLFDCMSVCLSVRPHGTTLLPLEMIFMKFDISTFFENMTRKFRFYSNLTRMTGTLNEDLYIFMVISR
jgi:hypothetical protein